jgi:hypothetical protein
MGVATDDVVKISVPPASRDIEKYGKWDGEPILAIAGSGSADGIGAITQLLFDKGEDAVEFYRAMRSKGFARSFDCNLIIVTANKAIGIIFNKTNDLASVRISKYKRHERVVMGSGTAAAIMAGKFFRTDEIGLVCAAIAMTNTCGGNVMIHDTNVKGYRTTSRHYSHPRLRVAWGGLRILATKVGTWFNEFFPY